PDLWRIRLNHEEAPALVGRLDVPGLRLGDLLRDPADREHPLDIGPLAMLRDGESTLAPSDDVVLRRDDALLLAGRLGAWAALKATMTDVSVASYVLDG